MTRKALCIYTNTCNAADIWTQVSICLWGVISSNLDMLTWKHRSELEENGYVVITDVLSEELCDACNDQYEAWLSNFTKDGNWPFSNHSLIQRYKVGHAEPTWKIRLAVKPIFAKLWGTSKLLSSFDAIAIGRPPEDGAEEFQRPDQHWLHTDQSANQQGLHTVQGAVYLESADEDDWTFLVLQKSHKHHENFMVSHPKAFLRSSLNCFYRLRDGEKEWFEAKGCKLKRIPVPKGGIVLWDSRLIHANAKPIKGRKHPGRWRKVVFVCMGPAIWATADDLKEKRRAYKDVSMTTHFPCQKIGMMPESIPSYCKTIMAATELPSIARTNEAQLLSGVLPYDFSDDKPNGPDWSPVWRGGNKPRYSGNYQGTGSGVASYVVVGTILFLSIFIALRLL